MKNKKDNHSSYSLSHPDKIVYAEGNITKQMIAKYYDAIHPWILPYVSNRPLTLVRCPNSYHDCFYQKHIDKNVPDGIYKIFIQEKSGKDNYIYINDHKGLMALSQMGVLELHPWGSRIETIEQPDVMVFDLDPAPGITWKKIVATAFLIRETLKEFKLTSFVKTTGGKGLHVVIPLKPEYDWEKVKVFTKTLVDFLVINHPKDYIAVMSKTKRREKIFVDYLRNHRGATSIAPYSTRARKFAPVATPVAWEELTHDIRDTFFTINNIPKRLEDMKKDPWEDFFKLKQTLNLKKVF